MQSKTNKILWAGILSLLSCPALAAEPCSSAKDLANLGQTFYGDKPELRDVITPVVKIRLKSLNDDPAPTAILYRHVGNEQILPVIDGELTEIERTASWSKHGEMCRMTGDELSQVTEDDSAALMAALTDANDTSATKEGSCADTMDDSPEDDSIMDEEQDFLQAGQQ